MGDSRGDLDLPGCARICSQASLDSTSVYNCLQPCLESYSTRSSHDTSDLSAPAAIALACALIPFTALFAGLTLGLLRLDVVGLRILEHAGELWERRCAKAILPIRRQGNLLLCTLLLGNTVVNAAISILLADLTTGWIGLLSSTSLILILGEIVPQSICTRYGLQIGAASIWIVKVFIILMWPLTYPISLLLDRVVGCEIGTVYSHEELKRLIDIHINDPVAQAESGLTMSDGQLIIGAFDYKHKRVRDVMTSLEQCFMLEASLRLTFQTMYAIYSSGFTRIPVFEGERQNIIGVLYAKDLILLNPEDHIDIRTVLTFRGRQAVGHVFEDEMLDVVFKGFISSSNHMLIAHRPLDGSLPRADHLEASPVTGLITLEDVLETVIQAEIVDETDVYEDVERQVLRQRGQRADVAHYLAMFEHKLHQSVMLSSGEMEAVIAFLSQREEFSKLAQHPLAFQGLISLGEVLELEPSSQTPGDDSDAGSLTDTPPNPQQGSGGLSQGQSLRRSSLHSHSGALPVIHSFGDQALWEPGSPVNDHQLVYQHGKTCDVYTLILQGHVLVKTVGEGFELELGPWTVLGRQALTQQAYYPDFDAVALAPCRLLRLTRPAFLAALETTQVPAILSQAAQRPPPYPLRYSGSPSTRLSSPFAAASMRPPWQSTAHALQPSGSNVIGARYAAGPAANGTASSQGVSTQKLGPQGSADASRPGAKRYAVASAGSSKSEIELQDLELPQEAADMRLDIHLDAYDSSEPNHRSTEQSEQQPLLHP